jgi:hypothetical protein
MFVAAGVLKPLTSNEVRLEQLKNIAYMSVTDDVLKLLTFKDVRLEQP